MYTTKDPFMPKCTSGRISSSVVAARLSRDMAVWSTVSRVLVRVGNRSCCSTQGGMQAAVLYRNLIELMSIVWFEQGVLDICSVAATHGNAILAVAFVGGLEDQTKLGAELVGENMDGNLKADVLSMAWWRDSAYRSCFRPTQCKIPSPTVMTPRTGW